MASWSETVRTVATPHGLFAYDRGSGLCFFTPDVKSANWTKPLYAQIALTEACNLSCWWCYASSSPEKARCWTLRDLKRLVRFLDSWGILGVAFGGGEPFLYRHLVGIAKWTREKTMLDVSVTTNGTAACERQIRRLEGYVSEVRVSIPSPDACEVLKKFIHRRFEVGVNLLLFRGNPQVLEDIVRRCLRLGVYDFLINSFKAAGRGAERPNMEPADHDFTELSRIIWKYGRRALFKVSGNLASRLRQLGNTFVPFSGEGRGRIIAITVDKKVKPSSLSEEAYPFSSPEEIPQIYSRLTRRGDV